MAVTIASSHCAYSRRDGQAELAGYIYERVYLPVSEDSPVSLLTGLTVGQSTSPKTKIKINLIKRSKIGKQCLIHARHNNFFVISFLIFLFFLNSQLTTLYHCIKPPPNCHAAKPARVAVVWHQMTASNGNHVVRR